MKNLFFFLALSVLTLASCSSDVGGRRLQNFSFTVNGVQKTFKILEVEQFEGNEEIYLKVKACDIGNPSELIVFELLEGDLGQGAVFSFKYTLNNITYFNNHNFTIDISQNSNNRLKGTFTGTLIQFMNPENLQIFLSDGHFDFSY